MTQHEKNLLYPVGEYDDAARQLDMHIHLADEIVWAADHNDACHPNYDPKLRAELLAACGVTEEAR